MNETRSPLERSPAQTARIDDTTDTSSASSFDLELLSPAIGGQMVARLDGQVVFVHGGIPGETVRAYVPARKKGYLEAEARAVELRSPDRATPACPYFGENTRRRGAIDAASDMPGPVCGGCQYQHIDYARQLSLKTEALHDVLRRLGKIVDAPVQPAIGSPHPYGYRNKAGWLVTPEGDLAYRESRSHRAVPIDACPLLQPALQQILEAIQGASADIGLAGLVVGIEARVVRDLAGAWHGSLVLDLPRTTTEEEARALAEALMDLCPVVRSVAGQHAYEDALILLAGVPRVRAAFLDEELSLSPSTFYQVNSEVADLMARYVLQQCEPIAGREIVDIYAGAGAFTIALARRAEAVIAFEIDAGAVADARETIERLGIETVTLLEGDAGHNLKAVLAGTVDCLLVDPPRAGCAPEVIRQLQRIRAARLIYVSCDPGTLSRDLRALMDVGYELERVQPFDIFPQTAHIESVSTLRLPKKYRARPR